jgi:predicted TIM-barrel fold metal-dependent hydrolase
MSASYQVIDNHAHVFPPMGTAAGYASPDEHLAVLQYAFAFSNHPARRVDDGALMPPSTLWDWTRGWPDGRIDVGFRMGAFGRVEWEQDGVAFYRQYQSPLLHAMASPPELVLAMMDAAGVGVAVLQNDRNYGRLNDEIADAVRRYPERFIGLAQVDEGHGWRDDRLREIERCASLGLRGLYFKLQGLSTSGYADDPFGPRYEPLWAAVQQRGWPVYWDIMPVPTPGPENYLRQLRGWVGWVARHPGIRSVLPNGLSTQVFVADGRVRLPDWLVGPLVEQNVLVELSLPIRWGGQWDYPFPESRQILDEHLERFGPTRLVWGSDMPNVERFCTYRQTITHLTEHWPGASQDDPRSIMGGNVAHLFGLDAEAGV